jgi:hypothetical protein
LNHGEHGRHAAKTLNVELSFTTPSGDRTSMEKHCLFAVFAVHAVVSRFF